MTFKILYLIILCALCLWAVCVVGLTIWLLVSLIISKIDKK